MNDTNNDMHNPMFGTLQEMNTRQQHTHPTASYTSRITIRNNQNSYTQHRGKKPTYQKA
jgi:hypothetical protein